MKTRLGSKHIATVLLALIVLVPASVSYAKNEEERLEKFKGLVEKAYEKVGDLVEWMQGIEGIDSSGLAALIEPFEGIDLDGITDVEQAKAAMITLRGLYGELRTFLEESGVDTESEAQAQGLIEAMERALERIERLREIPGLPQATSWILDNATLYLDIPEAAIWLNERRVNETAHNMTEANKLISLAHSTLQKKAATLKTQRIASYFRVIENLYNRLDRQVEKLADGGGKDVLEVLLETASTHIGNAEGAEDEEALDELVVARNILEEVEEGLKEQRRTEKGNGNGGA